MSGKMKAMVVKGHGQMEVCEVPRPEMNHDSVLIKVLACGVCGSDLRILDSGNSRVKYPAIIGHEIAGEIVEVGKNVKNFKSGQRLAVGADVPCGECSFCKNGMGNCCEINYAMGYQKAGGFAEYCLLDPLVLRHGPVVALDGCDLPPEELAVAEPLGCCLNGFERVSFSKGKSVLVIGSGFIGILLTRLARVLGASMTILSDLDAARLNAAGPAKADHLIAASGQELVGKVKDLTSGKGVDVVFTACPSREAQADALQVLANRGCVNFFGGLPYQSAPLPVSTNDIHYRELTLTGSHGSVPRQHAEAVRLIREGKINMKELLTHQFRLDEITKAFKTLRERKGLKVVVRP